MGDAVKWHRDFVPDGRGSLRLGWLMALLVVAAGCGSASSARFDPQNARAHVERLAGSIGRRPAGSTANQQARAYLIETLQLYGFDVRVQDAEAQWREGARTTRVSNIIAVRQGQQRDAIGIVAHYDSVPDGPGAGDDAFGVAVALESARILAARTSPRYSLMVLLTDGEEDGLMGARALVQDADVRARLRTYVNLEAIGTSGPVPLFETGPGSGPALRAWARSPNPRGGSYMLSVYKALPNDTDATVFRDLGVFGLNFAAVGDSHAYHTDRDRADRVSPRAMARLGENVVAIVERLEAGGLEGQDGEPVYFSVLDRRAFVMTSLSARVLGVLAVALGLFSWIALTRKAVRTQGIVPILVTFAWATLATGAVALALLGSVWLLRAARAELHPWHASPWRLFAFMTMMVVAMTWGIRRIAAALPPRLRPIGTPSAVWITALPIWLAAAVASLVYAVGASYLVSVPLLVAGLFLPVGLLFPAVVRAVSLLVAVTVWTLWGPDAWSLLHFVVAVLARFPLVTPAWLFPVLFLVLGTFLWPPVIGVLVGRLTLRVRHGLAGSILMTLVVITAALVLLAPAYTAEQPQRRSATFIDNRVTGEAYWRLAGNEPGVDIAAGPANVQWQPVARDSRGPWHAQGAFVFEGRVPASQGELPARVSSLVTRHAGGADLEVTIAAHAHERLSVAIVLPEGMVPTSSSLPGRTVQGRWRADFVNVPRDGFTWRAAVQASDADALARTELWMTRPGLPDGDPVSGLPAWLSRDRTAWSARTVTMTGLTPNEVLAPEASALGESVFAPTPLGRVHYLQQGTGTTALVFLHGWGGHAEHWTNQVPVAAGRRALFIDLPGHGRSDVSAGRHTVATLAEAVDATLQSAGVTRAVIVGHSLGALVGWHVALRAPTRVEALVSVDGTLLPFLTDGEDTAGFVSRINPADMGPFIDTLAPQLFTEASPADLRDGVIATMRATSPQVLAELMTDVAITGGPPFSPGQLRLPTLALVAASPDLPFGHEAQLRALFTTLDYRAMQNVGHYLMLERPRDVNDAIAGFLLGRGLLR